MSLAGCDASHTRHDTTIALVDSVRVQESEQLFVGFPNAIAAGPRGIVFISDLVEQKVWRVEADGRLTIVASKGGGPGEVMNPVSLTMLGDTVLAIKNSGQRNVELFDIEPQRFRVNMPIAFPTHALSSWKGTLLLPAMTPDSNFAFAVILDSTRAPIRGGSVPEIYRRLPPIAQAFGAVEVSRDDSTVAGVFEASNTIYRWHLSRAKVDSIVLAVTKRRGAQPAVLEALLRDPKKAPTLMHTWSFPMLLATQSGERTAIVSYDPTLRKGKFSGPSYLQLVDWRRLVSCRELALPVPTEIPPRFAMRGDTLIAVVQHADSALGASSWIVRWQVGAQGC